jgi:hypothetical protein
VSLDLNHESVPALPAPAPPAVRYFITPELWDAFTLEEVEKQKTLMIETGRWQPPLGEIIVRLHRLTVMGSGVYEVDDSDWKKVMDGLQCKPRDWVGAAQEMKIENKQEMLYDFQFLDGVLSRVDFVHRQQHPPCSPKEKRDALDRAKQGNIARFPDIRLFWEPGTWLSYVAEETDDAFGAMVEPLLDVLTIILHDRSVHRVEVSPHKLSPKEQRHGLAIDRPRVHETTLYVPQRIYTCDHGGTHASPHAHFRSEHKRNQRHGPGNSLTKEVIIDATWVNAADVPESERGTPIRAYKLKR